MSKKDYEALAEVINKVKTTGGDRGTLVQVITRLRPVLEKGNPRFNFELFAEACGFYLPS
jgi:hypothetical protein